MLSQVIGEILPLTLAIAISPLTVIAVILMLLSPHAKQSGPGFLLGWVLGISVVAIVFVLLAGALQPPATKNGPDIVRGVVQLCCAGLLLLLAAAQWRGRPAPGADPKLPKWMAALDSFTVWRAFALGLLLSVPRPKNLLVAASAGIIISGAGLPALPTAIAVGVFVLCSVSTVLVPVVAYLCAADRLRAPLEAAHRWLARENAVISSLLLFVIAVLLFGKGLGSF